MASSFIPFSSLPPGSIPNGREYETTHAGQGILAQEYLVPHFSNEHEHLDENGIPGIIYRGVTVLLGL